MGIRNQPAYETMDETNSDTAVADKATAADAGTTEETSAPAVQASGAVSTIVSNKLKLAFSDLKDVFDTATVEGLSMGTPRVKGEQGSFFKGDEDMGGKVHIEVVSWNHRWAIGTGENDVEAKEYFRVSYDNVHLADGSMTVAEYMDDLKARGFEKARVSPYIDLFCFITWTEKSGEIPVDARELVILQLSQTSVGQFMAFCTTRGLIESKTGAKPLDVVEVHAEKRAKGTNKYTNFSFHVPKS